MSIYEYALSEYERENAEQKATNAELETTIDGLADLSRDLEKDLDTLRSEVEAAIVELQGVLGSSVAHLPELLQRLIRDLKGALK